MDREQIRKALDHFENDQYVDAQEIIKREIAGKRDIFIKNKLGLENDFNSKDDSNDSSSNEEE